MAGEGGRGRLLLFALANVGGVIAYLPLLTLLLPLKVQAIAGEDRIAVLTAATIAGAVAASGANILFGALSDRARARGRGRRRGVAIGWLALAASYLALHLAGSAAAIVAAVVGFQVAVNAILAPLMAAMADEIPDRRKALAGGLLVIASPVASLVSAVLVGGALAGGGARLAVVCALSGLCLLPLLCSRAAPSGDPSPVTTRRPRVPRADLAFAWAGRLFVQVAGNVLYVYLLYYFESLAHAPVEEIAARVGHVQALAYTLPIPVAIVAGRYAARAARRVPTLLATATVAAAGLVAMAAADGWGVAVAGFAIYACGSASFLGLHQGIAMQMLPAPDHRGRDLGLLNLTNTLPALVGATLTWWWATAAEFAGLLLLLAALTFVGGLLMLPLYRTATEPVS